MAAAMAALSDRVLLFMIFRRPRNEFDHWASEGDVAAHLFPRSGRSGTGASVEMQATLRRICEELEARGFLEGRTYKPPRLPWEATDPMATATPDPPAPRVWRLIPDPYNA